MAGASGPHRHTPNRGLLFFLLLLTVIGLGATTVTSYAVSALSVGVPPGPPGGDPPGPPGGGDPPPDRPPCWPDCDERPPCWPRCDRDRDVRRPFVLEEFPRDGSFGVSRFTEVEVLFSEAVRGVDDDTFRLFDADTGRSVFADVFRGGTSRRWVLDPRAALSRSTRYVAVLRGGSFGIRDFAGNRLASTEWTFRTGGFAR